jgi:hypothetical protein
VQRLFDEGLARADAVIVVVSAYSAAKPWVREELDSATVQRIERGTRLVPVRLDDVEMPPPLRHLRWVNTDRTDAGVRRTAQEIADVLHEHDPRPLVGPPPTYITSAASIPGLTRADAVLLTETLREALELGFLRPLDWNVIGTRVELAGLTGNALMEALHALAEADYVEVRINGGVHVSGYELTRTGYAVGITAILPDVEDMHQRVIALLVNDPPSGLHIIQELAERSDTPRLVVDQLLQNLADRDLVVVSRALGDASRLHRVSPTLGRLLD